MCVCVYVHALIKQFDFCYLRRDNNVPPLKSHMLSNEKPGAK